VRALLLAAYMFLQPMTANAIPNIRQGDGLRSSIHGDLNAVRRARYALRKTKEGTPEREAAERDMRAAKQKLKDDRLKARRKPAKSE